MRHPLKLPISSDTDWGAISIVTDLNPRTSCTCVDDPTVSDIDSHVISIINNISGLYSTDGNALSGSCLIYRSSRDRNSKVLMYRPGKAGAVCPVGQAGSA